MKTGKQFLALTLGLLLVLGLFAGCQQEKAPATEPSTEPVTEAPTEAPTEEPTEAPTEATEPATEPEDAVTNVFSRSPRVSLLTPPPASSVPPASPTTCPTSASFPPRKTPLFWT